MIPSRYIIMGVKFIFSVYSLHNLYVLYYDNTLTEIYSNFSLFFPFLNITTYSDLLNHVILPVLFKTDDQVQKTSTLLFTEDELRKYDGKSTDLLYIAVLGNVFDVTSGATYYGVGKVYHGFTGKDGSRAFISGEFTEEGLTDHVLDLPGSDLLGLKDWLKMYENKYIFKGKLIGRYYDTAGEPTEYAKLLENKLQEALAHKVSESENKEKFPPCNVEWTAEKGSRVWCSARSGGIERNWIGVPRKLYVPGSKSYRCACVNIMSKTNEENDFDSKYFTEYEDCNSDSHSCYVKV